MSGFAVRRAPCYLGLHEEDDLHRSGSIVWALALAFTTLAPCAGAQEGGRLAYFRAVAGYFDLPPSEIAILGDWELAPDEIPVVLFVANRAGVSPEALVALRSSGRSWKELAVRYRIGASTLHVPLGAQAPAGRLTAIYERYRSVPVGEWEGIDLTDDDIISLVNVRVLSEALGMRPEDILGRVGASTFADTYPRLIG